MDEEVIKNWIKVSQESFRKATEGKDISMYFHCKNCKDKMIGGNKKAFNLEAGFVGTSKSLVRIRCVNCKKTIIEFNLLQAQIDVLEHFMKEQ